jgi:hypothetical protein
LAPDFPPGEPPQLLELVAEAAGAREAGFLAVVAPGSEGVEVTGDGRTGWLTWAELGTVALDLAEEGDELRGEQVHRLVDELQERFPGIEL